MSRRATARRALSVAAGAATTACLFLSAGSAQAATATVGSPLTAAFTPTIVGAGGSVTFFNTAFPEASALTAAPSDGTLVSWRYGGAVGGPFRLKVIRQVSATQYTGIATSAPSFPTGVLTQGPIPVQIPVLAGDMIGIDPTAGSDRLGFVTGLAGSNALAFVPRISDGQTRTPDPLVAGTQVAFNAAFRYCKVPKLKGKTAKKATNILLNNDCRLGKIKKPKKKEGKLKINKQSVKTGTLISDTKPINIQLGRASKKKK